MEKQKLKKIRRLENEIIPLKKKLAEKLAEKKEFNEIEKMFVKIRQDIFLLREKLKRFEKS